MICASQIKSLNNNRCSLSVAVIGAGAAGLVAARELHREGHHVTVFEQSSGIGGIWAYSAAVESDLLGGTSKHHRRLHNSMYAGLRTNLPREVMGYSDFPFDTNYPTAGAAVVDARRFCGHAEVQSYLLAFARHFDIMKHVRLNTTVMHVTEQPPREHSIHGWSWQVVSKDAQTNTADQSEVFDAVMVCNGHYSEPRVPDFPGKHVFPGLQMHTHNYRTPDAFRGKTVVVVGAAFSGKDIAEEVLCERGAAAVYLSARSWGDSSTETRKYNTDGVRAVLNIKSLNQDSSVEFECGTKVDNVDVVMYATGYVYKFPFLENNSNESSEEGWSSIVVDNRIQYLYKHCIPIQRDCSISFVGVPWKVVPFPQFELQSKWISQLLSGRCTLPVSREAMREEVDHFYEWMETENIPTRFTHRLEGELQFNYNLWLSEQCGLGQSGWPRWRQELYLTTGRLRRSVGLAFRDAPLEEYVGDALLEAKADAERQWSELRSHCDGVEGLREG